MTLAKTLKGNQLLDIAAHVQDQIQLFESLPSYDMKEKVVQSVRDMVRDIYENQSPDPLFVLEIVLSNVVDDLENHLQSLLEAHYLHRS